MKPSIIFRIQRTLYFLLKGFGKRETEHYLFTLPKPLRDTEIFERVSDYSWQPNYMGYAYKGQVYQARCLLNKGKNQYHVRFYDDGQVTGHFELSPEYDSGDHLKGKELRIMNKEEATRLWRLLLD